MAYNVKLNEDEVEHLAIVLHARRSEESRMLARTFSRIMHNSPRLHSRYMALRVRDVVSCWEE